MQRSADPRPRTALTTPADPVALAALRRAGAALLVPAVLVGGLVAAQGGTAERCWGIGVSLVVLVAGAVLVASGLRDRRQSRRRTATTLPSTVASWPGMGS